MDRGCVLHIGFPLSMTNLSHECACGLISNDLRMIEVGL